MKQELLVIIDEDQNLPILFCGKVKRRFLKLYYIKKSKKYNLPRMKMKMKIYSLLYNRVGVLNLGDARGIKVRNFLGSLYEFVLGGGVPGGYTIDVGGDGEAKRLGTPLQQGKAKKLLFFSIQLLYR
jgi:hypothetical protein